MDNEPKNFYAEILEQYQNQKISGGKVLDLIGQLQELMRCEFEPEECQWRILNNDGFVITDWEKCSKYQYENPTEYYLPLFRKVEVRALYAAPQKREPLSDLEIINICEVIEGSTTTKEDMFVNICRDIEKHHGIGH